MNPPDTVSERRRAIDQLDREIVRLAAGMNAINYRLLVRIRQFDERAGWLQWGYENCAQWLNWRIDLSLSAAREKVRVAHQLKGLPELSAAFAAGTLSYSKVRALTRVANASNEDSLLSFAMTTTASRVEERCRQMRNVDSDSTEEANGCHRHRSLRAWHDRRRGMMTITVEVPVEDGEIVVAALDQATETGEQPEFGDTPWSARQADALVAIARGYLAGGSYNTAAVAQPHQILVHVDEAALTNGVGRSDLPVESVRRLSCDTSLVKIVENADGEPLNVGRSQRTVPTAIQRALWARDRGCSFPGCSHRKFVDAHHIQHWSQGGETSVDNLMLLCSRHHRLVHEGGYQICKDVHDEWYFKRPDGRAIPSTGFRPEDTSAEGHAVNARTRPLRGGIGALAESQLNVPP